MMGRWREDRALHWRKVLRRQLDSGLSVAEFCRQESISAASFYSWRGKFRQRDRQEDWNDQRIDKEGASASQLLPVRIESADRSGCLRVLLPQAVAIDVPGGTDPGALAGLLRALREAQLC